jgi:peroxiredoxin
MKQMLTALTLALALASASDAGSTTATPAEVKRAREILESSARAYRSTAALSDTLSYVVDAPGSERETKTQEYAFGPGRAARIKNALLEAVALNNEFYLVQSDVPGRYVFARYDGDFGAVLRRIAGNGSLFEPPPLAMHEGKNLDLCIDTLRFNLLDPLRIAGCSEAVAGDDGKSYAEVRFIATNGELNLRIDRQTKFFAAVSFQVQPAGAPDGFVVRITGTFTPRTLSGSEASIEFNPGARSAVHSLTELNSKRLVIDSPAPDFELESLDGKKIALHDLKGSAVLLDFWATWCVPCWKALKETQSIADWAAAENLPVRVFAVNTLEQGTDAKDKAHRVRAFWRSQHLNMTTLLDSDSRVFNAFASPGLPSVVLISPTGTILRHHEGLFPEMRETLKKELRDILNTRKNDAGH